MHNPPGNFVVSLMFLLVCQHYDVAYAYPQCAGLDIYLGRGKKMSVHVVTAGLMLRGSFVQSPSATTSLVKSLARDIHAA